MKRAVPSSGMRTYSKTVTYLSFERSDGDWIEWGTYVRQVVNLLDWKTGKIKEQTVRHNTYWRELHPREELDIFLAGKIGKIVEFSSLQMEIEHKSGTSKLPLPFLLWSDENLGTYY